METGRAPTKTAVIPAKGPRLTKMIVRKILATTMHSTRYVKDWSTGTAPLVDHATASNRGGFYGWLAVQPMSLQPSNLGFQGRTALRERPELRTIDGTEIGEPVASWSSGSTCEARRMLSGPSMARSKSLVVDAAALACGFDNEFHWRHLLRATENVPPRPINEQTIQHRLDAGELPRDLVPQCRVITQGLRLDTAN